MQRPETFSGRLPRHASGQTAALKRLFFFQRRRFQLGALHPTLPWPAGKGRRNIGMGGGSSVPPRFFT